MKRVRRSSSSHSVKTSSNWSTTSSPATSGTEGRSPGVMTSPGPNAGSTPARSTDDFPLPELPTTATKPRSRTRRSSSSATSSRPKNSSRSSRWNGSSPGYGHSVAGFGVLMPGAEIAKTCSVSRTPRSRWGPRSTRDAPSGIRLRTRSAVTRDSNTSPPSPSPRIRAAMLSAGPKYVSSRRSASPVWSAVRTRSCSPSGHSSAPSRRFMLEHGGERLRRVDEYRHGRVALAHRLDEPASSRFDGGGDQLVVPDERLGHRRGLRIPHRRRSLDVRHAEREDAGREGLSPTRAEPLEELAGRLRPPHRVGGETEPQCLFELLGLRRVEPVP